MAASWWLWISIDIALLATAAKGEAAIVLPPGQGKHGSLGSLLTLWHFCLCCAASSYKEEGLQLLTGKQWGKEGGGGVAPDGVWAAAPLA